MFVYVVSMVSNQEYGDTRIEKIFGTMEGAQAYLDELVPDEENYKEGKKICRGDIRIYPWYADDDGELLYSIEKWAVC